MSKSKKPIRILEVYFLPPVAIGRLGGSPTPLESYIWKEDPTIAGAARTVIAPDVTLDVCDDGTLRPYLPAHLRIRDGARYRPVAPFFELWASFTTPDRPDERQEAPVTSRLLERAGASLENLSYDVTAANLKAARRTGDSACGFEARLRVVGTDHGRHALLASTPIRPGSEPLVFTDRPIPLGFFQAFRPLSSVDMGVDLSVVRVRFTPAAGDAYGPPTATSAPAPVSLRSHVMVKPENRFLNPRAAWLQYNSDYGRFRNPEPSDTYDGAAIGDLTSWGVVDDTCDALIGAQLVIGGIVWQTQARVAVGPPHFALDRRPFVSLADDLTDRDPPSFAGDESDQEEEARINDLFQRVWEVAGLFNLDANRDRGLRNNGANPAQLPGLPFTDRRSMTAADVGFVDLVGTAMPSVPGARLPLSDLIKLAHGQLADLTTMVDKLREEGPRIRQMLRPPYGFLRELASAPSATPTATHRDPRVTRDTQHDMRMPPYMRDSDASPLSLTHRQYDEVLALVKRLEEAKAALRRLKATAGAEADEAQAAQIIPDDSPIRRRVNEFLRNQAALGQSGGADD